MPELSVDEKKHNQEEPQGFAIDVPIFETILESAIGILNYASGVLMIADQVVSAYTVVAAAGSIVSTLKNRKVPAGNRYVNQALLQGKPLLIDPVDREALWFSQTDPELAAKIDDMLVISLKINRDTKAIFALFNRDQHAASDGNQEKIIQGVINLAEAALRRLPWEVKPDFGFRMRAEELSTLQQISAALHGTREIDLALQITLREALKNTSARAGTIGIIKEDFEVMDDLWQLNPETDAPIKIEEVDLRQFPSLSTKINPPSIVKDDGLSTQLKLPVVSPWHYLMGSQLIEDQYYLLFLHLSDPNDLTETEIQFLTQLNEHAVSALTNAVMYQELMDAIHAKNEFIGYISHEIKNPLTVIKGYADILNRGMAGPVNEEQRDYLTTITHNVHRLNSFITDLSDQSHIETKSLRLSFESTPLREVVHDVLHTYAGEISKHKLKIETQISDQIPDVWCDRMRLNQILSNLISNAIKYTPEGGRIIIRAESTQNMWDVKGAAEVVHVWVQDNGFGISKEDQTHLFEKFFRGTDSRIRKIPGTGLGLRIARSLTEMMGGKLWFTSVEGQGSTFHFTIPI